VKSKRGEEEGEEEGRRGGAKRRGEEDELST
jgi:hypothetical protein